MGPPQVFQIWNRSVTMPGDPRAEGEIQQALVRQYPPKDFPFHIDLMGAQQLQDGITVRLWNNQDLDVTGHADLKDVATSNRLDGELLWALLNKVAELVDSLKHKPTPTPERD